MLIYLKIYQEFNTDINIIAYTVQYLIQLCIVIVPYYTLCIIYLLQDTEL